MDTLILNAGVPESIELCAGVIKNGGVVAFPTETVYGLGADALDAEAVSGIYDVKGRPMDNPVIVHVASPGDVKPLVTDIPDVFDELVSRYWPGPLTLIMRKSSLIPDNVTAGLDTVAIRMPEHPAALALLQAFGGPVAAPSANPSGKPSPTKAGHVKNDLDGKIPYILDGGDCKVGIESTVLDISGEIPKILRPGYVTYDELKSILETLDISGTEDAVNAGSFEKPVSPGMKYRHYAPKASLTAVSGPPEKTAGYITARVNDETAALMFDDYASDHPNVVSYGDSRDYVAQASRLFESIRGIDVLDVTVVYAQVPDENGLGFAIANRIKKAAGDNIVELV